MTGTLTVVIPCFNGQDWILRTIDCTRAAIESSGWAGSDIIVVDDGSTDETPARLDERAATDPLLHVIHTPNQGRFLARRTGIEAAAADLVLLIDTRVLLEPDALAFLHRRIDDDDGPQVWNGHVEIDTRQNPYARFWQAITFVAWRRYLANPRPVSFGPEDFDHYPKGTGCFLAPRQRLLRAYEAFSSHYDDLRRVNDDTSLIRGLAEETPIHIDPRFACTYHARGSFRGFLVHSFYRGMHFVDGYLRPGNRFFVPLLAILALTPVGMAALALAPVVTLGAALIGLVMIVLVLVALRVPPRTSLWFGVLLTPFAAVYLAGIWRGVLTVVMTRRLRSSR